MEFNKKLTVKLLTLFMSGWISDFEDTSYHSCLIPQGVFWFLLTLISQCSFINIFIVDSNIIRYGYPHKKYFCILWNYDLSVNWKFSIITRCRFTRRRNKLIGWRQIGLEQFIFNYKQCVGKSSYRLFNTTIYTPRTNTQYYYNILHYCRMMRIV